MSSNCTPEVRLQDSSSYYYTALNTTSSEPCPERNKQRSLKDLPGELLSHIFSYMNCSTLPEIHPLMLVCNVFYKHILADTDLCLNLPGLNEMKKFQIINTIREGRAVAHEHAAYENTPYITKQIYNLFYEINFGCFETLPLSLYVTYSVIADELSYGLYGTCIESERRLKQLRSVKSYIRLTNQDLVSNKACYIEKHLLLKYTSTRNRFHEITGIPRPLTYFIGPLFNQIFLLNAVQSGKQIGIYNVLDRKVAGLRLLSSRAEVENNKSYCFLFIPHGINCSDYQWNNLRSLDLRNKNEELCTFIQRISSGEMDQSIFTENVPTVLVVSIFDSDLFEVESIFNEAFTFPKSPKFYSSPEHRLIHKLVTSISEQLKGCHEKGECISNHESFIDEIHCMITIKIENLTGDNCLDDHLLAGECSQKLEKIPQYALHIETSKGRKRPPIDMLNFEVIQELVLSRPEYKTLSIQCNVEGDIKFLP